MPVYPGPAVLESGAHHRLIGRAEGVVVRLRQPFIDLREAARHVDVDARAQRHRHVRVDVELLVVLGAIPLGAHAARRRVEPLHGEVRHLHRARLVLEAAADEIANRLRAAARLRIPLIPESGARAARDRSCPS